MNRDKIFSLLGLIFLCSYAQADTHDRVIIQEKMGPGSFTPENPPPVSYQDSDLTLKSTYGIDHQVSILIQESASQLKRLPDRQVTLPDGIAQLNEVRPLYGNKIAAIGLVNSAVSVTTIIDRSTGVVIDMFDGYRPTISPNGRWIAFQEFFPSHFYYDIKSCYRVYDASYGASQNRLGHADVSDTQWVGTSVYPLRPRSQQVECGATSKDGEFMMSSDTFLWGQQSDQFLFAVSEGKALNLVLVKLNESSKQWQTFIYDLNKDKHVCSATSCDSARVISLALEGNAVITQVFPGTLGDKPLNLSTPIDEFVLIKP